MSVRPFVEVEGKRYPKGGDFLLTTVSLKRGNILDYLASKLWKDIELVPISEILVDGESRDQYERRQQENMHDSQQNAIISAYHYAHKPVRVCSEGVEVFEVRKVHSELKQGDLIKKIDDKQMSDTEDFLMYLKRKRVGQVVNVEFVRNTKRMTKRITLIRLPGKEMRVGFGIIPV